MRRLPVILLLLISIFNPRQAGSAQLQVEFSDLGAFYKYGELITFQAKIQPANMVKELSLFIQPEGQARYQEKISLNSQGEVIYAFDLKINPIRPFAQVNFWFQAVTSAGTVFESLPEAFVYEENLTEWKRLEEDRFVISWHNGDPAFGQLALNTARAGLRSVNSYLPLVAPPSIRIYIYENLREVQSALIYNKETWVAGYTSPDMKVILVSIAPGPGQQSEMERQIPHEIAHIVVYQIAGDSAYYRLPTWLNEGLASLAEITPNLDYPLAIEKATRSNQLIPMESLCTTFPKNASSAFLAYAQSASFIRYYFQQFSSSGLINLISQYQNQPGCAEGVQSAVGVSLTQLESRWHQTALGLTVTTLALQTLAPYFLIALLLILIPLGVGLGFRFHRKTEK